jgi:hypothetical protein
MHYYRSRSEETDLADKIDTYCDALVGLSEVYDSPVVIYNMYLVWAYRYEMTRDWEAMLEVCNRAEAYVETNPIFYQEGKVTTFQIKKMTAYLHLRDYKNGKINAEKSLQSFEDGSEIWFTFLEYYLLLAMHTDNYISALAILNRAMNNSKFKRLSVDFKEKWLAYEAFLAFLMEAQTGSNLISQASKRKTFKVAKFLTDSVAHSKEAKILTVHVLVIQTLFHIKKRSFPAANETIEKLKIFANRQLKPEDYYRTVQFIRLMQQLPKADYKKAELSNIEKYYNRLLSTPFSYRGLLHELEVIPYEKLWDLVLEQI